MAGDVRLPDIKASVKVDSKDVDAGLNRVQSSTRGAGKEFTGLQKSASGAIDSMTSSLTSRLGPASGAAESALAKLSSTGSLMGPAIAGGAAVAGVAIAAFAVQGAQAFVGLAGEIRNFQRASGASAEDSSRFVAVLDDLGIASDTGAAAVFKLGKSLKDGGDNLRAYGIEVARSNDGTVDLTGTMLNVADAYAKTPDPAKRAELAFAAFGKQGQSLIPILEQGREGLQAFFEGAEEGRQIFSQEDLDKARKYELAMDELSDTFRGLQLEAGEVLLPFITSLATAGAKVIGFASDVKEKVGGALETVGRAMLGVATAGASEGILFAFRKLSGGSNDAKKSQKELAEQAKETAAAQLEEAEASKAQALALDKVTNATLAAVSSQLGYEASLNTLKDNINDIDDREREYAEAVAASTAANKAADVAVRTYGAGSEEAKDKVKAAADAAKDAESANRALRDAHLGVEQSAIATANAAVKLADEVATAGGQALTAQEKAGIFRQSLIDLANQTDGPTKQAILDLAANIVNLPDRSIFVDADTSSAHAKLNSLENRMAYLAAKGVSLENDTNTGTAGDPDARALGGPVLAGRPYIVGEHRPELFIPEVNGRIVPQVPAAYASGSTSGDASAPPVVHTTIVIDRKVVAEAAARGSYEARRR
jgi:hypothetical protein